MNVERVQGRTFQDENRLSKDHLSSKPDRLNSLNGPKEWFLASHMFTWSGLAGVSRLYGPTMLNRRCLVIVTYICFYEI